MPPKISAATMASATSPTHFGTKIPAGRSVVESASGAGAGSPGAATGAACVGASAAGATSSSSPDGDAGGDAAAAGAKGSVSAVGVSSGTAGDGVPSGRDVSSVMGPDPPGSTLPTLMVVGPR